MAVIGQKQYYSTMWEHNITTVAHSKSVNLQEVSNT